MKNIAVIYGGKSPEHDISILTGLHCAKHITDDYRVYLIYLTKENKFVTGKSNIDDYINGRCKKWTECRFSDGSLYRCGKFGKKICEITCAVNCCHGGVGESGELYSLLKIANIPITSCDFLSAYAQQSKIATRKILTEKGFTQPEFFEVSKLEYEYLGERVTDNIKIAFPVIIKPDNLGSSIGITVAKTKQELLDGLELAFTMCEEAIVEEYISGMKEVNIAVMRHKGELALSSAEAVGGDNFFSYEEKYLNAESGFIKKGTGKEDAFVKKVEAEIGALAKQAYEIFGSSGVVRSDFIITDTKTILNENNTVPGFMAYHLWLKNKVPYGVVIDSMISDAVERFERNSALKTEFNSEILTKNRKLVSE